MNSDIEERAAPTRLEAAAPHFGSFLTALMTLLLAAIISLGYFGPIVVLVTAALIGVSPFLGAFLVMHMQERGADWRGPTLYPYLWWSVVASSCFAASFLISWLVEPGINPPSSAATFASWKQVAGYLQASGFGIAAVVPVLRFVMWLIKPPLPIKVRSH